MGSAFYLWLGDVEEALVRMIRGVFRFITEGLWEWIFHFVVDTLGPVTIRLGRVLALACLWLMIVFSPVAVGVRFSLPWWWAFGSTVWVGLCSRGVRVGTESRRQKRKAAVPGLKGSQHDPRRTLEKIEALLVVLVERQQVREWYSTEEFAVSRQG